MCYTFKWGNVPSRATSGNWRHFEWSIFVPLFFLQLIFCGHINFCVPTRIKLTGVDCSWQCPIYHWQTNGKMPVTSVIILQKVQKYSGSPFLGRAKKHGCFRSKPEQKSLKYPLKKKTKKKSCVKFLYVNGPAKSSIFVTEEYSRWISLFFFFFFSWLTLRESMISILLQSFMRQCYDTSWANEGVTFGPCNGV